MIDLIVVAILLCGFYVTWNIGANDTANYVGTAVGGRLLTYRRAIAIVILFVLLGAMLEGWKNMKTVGEGIVVGPDGSSPFPSLPLIVIATLLAAGTWAIIATTFGLPISTSQSIVGAIIGAGLLISFASPGGITASVKFDNLGTIALSWVLNPIGAAILAFAIFKIVGPLLRRIKNVVVLNRVLLILVVIASAACAYAAGANDVGASTGAIYAFFGGGSNYSLMQIIALFGAVALAVGTLTYSGRVIRTVSSGITTLDPVSAFAAQMGSALSVWLFVQFRMPVSTSQAIVGAVVGAGLVKGTSAVSKRKIGQIGIAWVATPAISCLLAFILGWLFTGV